MTAVPGSPPRVPSLEGLDVSNPEYIPDPRTIPIWRASGGSMELDFADTDPPPFVGGYRDPAPRRESDLPLPPRLGLWDRFRTWLGCGPDCDCEG